MQDPIIKTQNVEALLNEVVAHVFESIFFVEVTSLSTSEIAKLHDTEGLEIFIDINSDFCGTIRMYLSLESALNLARVNLNAALGEITNDILADTFAEVLNTIGGRVACGFQSNSSFDLSSPKVNFGKIATSSGAQITSCYRVEHGLVCFAIVDDSIAMQKFLSELCSKAPNFKLTPAGGLWVARKMQDFARGC